MFSPVRIYTDIEEARASVLKRRVLQHLEASPGMRARIEAYFGSGTTPQMAVESIIDRVAREGDAALKLYTKDFDGVELDDLRVSASDLERAYNTIPAELRSALELAAQRVREFHEKQPRLSWMDWHNDGALGQIVRPLQRVGIYNPGGLAPLASSLMMAAVPARVAGVEEIVVCTPPRQKETGLPDDVTLAAAYIAGVDFVYCLGGAQAIAAMALGTESVPRVDKVLGPGNLLVVLAKKTLFGAVGIESLPGPTETLIIADGSANPLLVAVDMLAQAEHDPLASAILLTDNECVAEDVKKALDNQLARESNQFSTARESLAHRGGIVLCQNMTQAMTLANDYAPEHLCLLVRDPWALLPQVRNAGGVFLGESVCESLGDYVIGPSHIMPTGGTARFSSPLNVWDFVKITSVFAISEAEAGDISEAGAILADAEGLSSHASAIRSRRKERS